MPSASHSMHIKAEHLAYWYLRLNGFLTIANFVVHHETESNQRTDVDVLGVRFPYRAELHPSPMKDDKYFTSVNGKPYIVIAEVKKGKCKLNGPWTKPEKRNMSRVLRGIGALPNESTEEIAEGLYKDGVVNDSCYISLLCFGNAESRTVKRKYPKVPQITWHRVLHFIYRRFTDYAVQKVSHGQWD
jgi:hypothetical protein